MRWLRAFSTISFTILLVAGGVSALCQQSAETAAHIISSTPDVAVGSQYDSIHVYIAPQDFDGFVSSVLATFDWLVSPAFVRRERQWRGVDVFEVGLTLLPGGAARQVDLA